MPLVLRSVAWLFIAEGVYDVFQVLASYVGSSGSTLAAFQSVTVLLAGLKIVAGIGILGQDTWARQLALYISGFSVLVGVVSLVSLFSGSIGLLLTTLALTAIYAFQFGVVVYSTAHGD